MKLSCICLTYGRPQRLAEAVECFLRQQCDAPIELLIFNTCPQQQLRVETENPSVRVINCTTRPKSLGNARNLAIAQATGDWLVTWDDDDLYLPHYLQRFSDALKASPQAQWLWQSHQFYSEGGKIRKTTSGTCNTFAFTREAWEAVGRYDETKNVGEDAALISRITASLPGTRCAPEPCDAGFIYCWGNGVYHVSGQGDDARQKLNSWRRAELAFLGRLRAGVAKAGQVSVRPAWRNDYQAAAREFLGANKIQPINPAGTAVVMLGRYGDIINALPICKHLHDEGKDPHLIVAREFAPILDGVSYVKPVVLPIPFEQLTYAMGYAKQRFKNVIRAQIYGRGHRQEIQCASFNQESWREAGFLDKFSDPSWKPVFDRRNSAVESKILSKLFRTNKPKILVNLTSAKTARLRSGSAILPQLMSALGETYEVIDIGKLRLGRIYELVCVMEAASLIVSIDTATLHLAAATNTPVVALLPRARAWGASVVRYNCAASLSYEEASIETLLAAVLGALGEDRIGASAPMLRLDLPNVTLWACCWSNDAENLSRTVRVLRYCQRLIQFERIVLFSHLPVSTPDFPLDVVRIPKLDMTQWNVFHNREVPKHIASDFALSVHADGFPLDIKRWRKEFLDYDYIGAPWADGVVGNGGFCLESRKFRLEKMALPHVMGTNVPSDVFTCRLHRKRMEAAGVRFAPVALAREFSVEQMSNATPTFGFHGRRDRPKEFALGWRQIEENEALDKFRKTRPIPVPTDAFQNYQPPPSKTCVNPTVTLVYIHVPGDPNHQRMAKEFGDSYRLNPPLYNHDTVIVMQGEAGGNTTGLLFDPIFTSFKIFQHDDSGFDIGAYIAASKTIKADIVVCFGGSSYFKQPGWMKRMVEAWVKHGPGMYGAIATHEVSPHLSTSGFWCSPAMLESYPIKVTTKAQRYDFEHGPNALWKMVAARGYPVKLVTWDGEYDWPDWRKPPNIFRRGNQSSCIAYWHHCRRFDAASRIERAKLSSNSDGLNDPIYTRLKRGEKITPDVVKQSMRHFLGAHGFK